MDDIIIIESLYAEVKTKSEISLKMHLSIFQTQKGKIITMKLQETCLACVKEMAIKVHLCYSFITSSGNLDFRLGDNRELKTTFLFILLEMNGIDGYEYINITSTIY